MTFASSLMAEKVQATRQATIFYYLRSTLTCGKKYSGLKPQVANLLHLMPNKYFTQRVKRQITKLKRLWFCHLCQTELTGCIYISIHPTASGKGVCFLKFKIKFDTRHKITLSCLYLKNICTYWPTFIKQTYTAIVDVRSFPHTDSRQVTAAS